MESSSNSSLEKTRVIYEENVPVGSVHVSGDGGEFITLGDRKFYRHELMSAFAGRLMPEKTDIYPYHPFGGASAVGLAGYGITNFTLGLYLSGAMGVELPSVAFGLCIFAAGFLGAVMGIWELYQGNTFAGTTLASFGMGFWISFGVTYMPAFGVLAAYKEEPEQLNNAIGFYLLGWGIWDFMIVLVTLKTTFPFMMLFVTVDCVFFVLSAHYFTGSAACLRAGGILCIISACCGWYCSILGTANTHNSYIKFPNFLIPLVGKNSTR